MNVESSLNAWKRSSQGRIGAILALLVALFATSCGSVPKTSYYALQVPAAPSPADVRTTFSLGVEHFRAPLMLRDNRIVYYASPTQMNFYQYQRWGSDPATMLSEYTAQWLSSTGVFAQVRMLPLSDPVDYALGGRILSFEEVDADGGAKVRLGLALTLVRKSDHKLVWSGEQREESPLQGHGVEGVATALNTSCAQALREMIPGLIAQVEQDYKSSGK